MNAPAHTYHGELKIRLSVEDRGPQLDDDEREAELARATEDLEAELRAELVRAQLKANVAGNVVVSLHRRDDAGGEAPARRG
jgi:hypothetical protein